jgi:CDP-diacylglycerol--serine O-phosphatidyltransferase
MKKYIPNFLSILNLISGTIGVVLALNGKPITAACAIFTGAIFDFLDGFLARLLRAQSLLGKQLDSLADLITFGYVPAGIMYVLIKQYEACPYRPYAALCMVVFSALRLAKFNIDPTQTQRFAGLPTPANALFVATLPMLLERNTNPWLTHLLTQPLVLTILTLVLSFLLVSRFSFIAFKFQGSSLQKNKVRYGLVLFFVLFVSLFKTEGLFASIWLYLILSLVIGLCCSNKS